MKINPKIKDTKNQFFSKRSTGTKETAKGKAKGKEKKRKSVEEYKGK